MRDESNWWNAEQSEVHARLMSYVSEVERVQSSLFERFHKLATLYDPYFEYMSGHIGSERGAGSRSGPDSDVSENVIASSVDTVTAIVAGAEVRGRFMTDEGDWTAQRNARHLEWYAEGLAKLLGVNEIAVSTFRDAALKGTGMIKVYVDPATEKIRAERVLIDDIIVDEGGCRAGAAPQHMQQRAFVDKEELRAAFPEHEAALDAASDAASVWAGSKAVARNQVVVVETWRLPIGKRGTDNYRAGRHAICITGLDLLDEEWHKTRFPFARVIWTERASGWYGIGGAERIAGHQRRINKMNWQHDRQRDQLAVPTTYVRMADANLMVKTTTRFGTVVPYKADLPKTVIPQAVSAESDQRLAQVRESAYEEFGVSRLAATSKKPAGLDSGAALREYRDATTSRFLPQEKAHERLVLDVLWLALDAAHDLGSKAPVIFRRSRWGAKKIEWKKLDMEELRVQIAAASAISRTPAGRMQTVLEWAQAGVVSQDEARRLMRHPDLERAMSLYTVALEDIERSLEEILDGATLTPEPFQNLRMLVWRGQQEYLKVSGDGAPEEILENLRQYIVQAAGIIAMQQRQEAQEAMQQQMAAAPPLPQTPPASAFSSDARLGLRLGGGGPTQVEAA